MAEKDRAFSEMSWKRGKVRGPLPDCPWRRASMVTMRSGSAKASGRRRSALAMEKIEVLAPMPMPRVRIAMAVNPGDLRKLRITFGSVAQRRKEER
jgi:hypothetical protein